MCRMARRQVKLQCKTTLKYILSDIGAAQIPKRVTSRDAMALSMELEIRVGKAEHISALEAYFR